MIAFYDSIQHTSDLNEYYTYKIPKSQFTIHSHIFLPKILQRPILINLKTQYKSFLVKISREVIQ